MFTFLKNLLHGIIAKFGPISSKLEHYISVALAITGILKTVENSQVGQLVLNNILAPYVGKENISKITEALSYAINTLTASSEIMGEADPEKKLKLFLEDLQKLQPLARNKMFMMIAQLITASLDNHQHPQAVYDSHVQNAYTYDRHIGSLPVTFELNEESHFGLNELYTENLSNIVTTSTTVDAGQPKSEDVNVPVPGQTPVTEGSDNIAKQGSDVTEETKQSS